MYEDFGAVVTGNTITFRVFFPDNTIDPAQYQRGGLPKIVTLRVAGNFQQALGGSNWDFVHAPELIKQQHLHGWLYTLEITGLPQGFYEYKYFIGFENGTTRWCSDPCSKYGGFENENSGFIIGNTKLGAIPIERRLPLDQLVIYELMLDDFTAGYRGGRAPLDAVMDKLDELQALGINAIEFMPWTTWPEGEFSWGYDPVSFFSVEFNYYNDNAQPLVKLGRLQALINELHRRGIHVIMDGVFNHANAGPDPNKGFAYYWLYQQPEDSPYIGQFGEGGFFNEFDFANNCVDEFIIDICKYWINEYSIDGIRFDYVKGFYLPNDPEQGIGELILYLQKFAEASQLYNLHFILELLPDNRYDAINDTNQIKAGACWFDPFMWESISTAQQQKITPGLLRALDAGRDFAPAQHPVVYLENHDHSTVMQQCGGRHRWWVTQPLAIALFTIAGVPFIHNGQEYGEMYGFPEEGYERVQRRPLQWECRNDEAGGPLVALYTKLIKIRKENPVLSTNNFYPGQEDIVAGSFNLAGYGADAARGLVVYHRWGKNEHQQLERYIIALNFSGKNQVLNIPFSANGQWKNLLDDSLLEVEHYVCNNYSLGSHWGAIFKMVI